MLNKITQENLIILMLSSIFLNYLFLISPLFTLLVKINIICFFFLNILYFYKFNNNLLLLIIIVILIIICLGSLTYQWDARSLWGFKAKRIFIEGSIFTISDNYAPFSHPDYPNLGPAFIAGFAKLIGYWNEIFPKLALTLMYIPVLLILNRLFIKNFFLLSLILIFFTIGKFIVNGEMDGLVSIYFTLSALTIYNISISDNPKIKSYITPLLLVTILSLLKMEGFVLSVVLLLISKLFLFYKKELNYKIIFYFILALIPGSLWQIFTYLLNISNDYTSYNYNFGNFSERFLEIKDYFLITNYLIFNEKFLISVFFFLFSFYLSKNKDLFIFAFVIIMIYSAILYTVYLSTPLDLNWHLNSSATRVIKPMILFLFLFGVYSINNKDKLYKL